MLLLPAAARVSAMTVRAGTVRAAVRAGTRVEAHA